MLLTVIAQSIVLLELVDKFTCQISLSDKSSISITKKVILSEFQNWIKEKNCRYLFWIVFLLNRLTTIVTVYNFTLDNKTIKRQLFCYNNYFTNNNCIVTRFFKRFKNLQKLSSYNLNTDIFALYFEILKILLRVYEFLKRTSINISISESVQI